MIHKIQCQKVVDEGLKEYMADEAVNYLKRGVAVEIGVGLLDEKLIEFKISKEVDLRFAEDTEMVLGRVFVIDNADIIKLKNIISKIRGCDEGEGWELNLYDEEVKFLYSL